MAREFTFGAGPERLRRLLFEGLEEPESQEDVTQSRSDDTTRSVGEWIGRYRLIHTIGEGGMGIVYLAEQVEPIRRKVALKVIKPGMDSKRVIARFEAERQALALLDHPNIAHVYDAGTTESGRPYFVMEFIKGLPVTEHCDRHKLTIEDRLRLFQLICQAVQHAHQKGIIHRDIKPSNILVSKENDRSIPKIIDFGVAKALAQPLTERTLATEDSQLLGTPEYMSPEQADMAIEDIDTRSDIYSLGVLLYVLLTGILPFDSETFREGGIEHIRKIIRETDPKTPSTRLTKLGEKAKAIAKNRRMEIQTLARNLRKELEWIPLKAMRKECSERYRSASELADDIENYLMGVPLIAGPLSTSYKLKKFVRRNRVLVGGITAVMVILIVGVVVSTIFAIGQAHALAENKLISDFLKNDVLGSADEARVGEATLSYTLDAASKNLKDKFKNKPLIEASLCRTIGETYRKLGEYKKAEQQILRAIEIYRQSYGESHPDTLSAMSHIGWVYIKQGRYHDMERLYTNILNIKQRMRGKEHPVGTSHGLAVAYYLLGKYKQAESMFIEMLQSVRHKQEGETSFPHVKVNLAIVYGLQGRYEKAEPLFIETLSNHPEGAYHVEFASMYREQGRYDKAEPLLQKALESQLQRRGDEYFHTLETMYGLARLYIDQERYNEAQSLLSKALPIAQRGLRENHPLTLRFMNAYAVLHTKQEQYEQAEKLFDEALKSRQHELGDDHPETLETINDFGILHMEQKHYEQAEKLLTEAFEVRKVKLSFDHPHTLQSMHELAVLYKKQTQYEKAKALLLEAVEGRRLKLGNTHPHTIESINNLIDLYEALNKPEEAEKWREKLPQTEALRE